MTSIRKKEREERSILKEAGRIYDFLHERERPYSDKQKKEREEYLLNYLGEHCLREWI